MVAAQVAGVVIGEVERLRCEFQAFFFEQAADVGAVVFHRQVQPQVLVIASQSIVAVRASGHDPLDAVGLDAFDVRFRQRLVQVFVAQFPQRFAAALLFLAQDAHPDAGRAAYGDEALGDLLVPFVERGVATDEIEDVHLLRRSPRCSRPGVGPLAARGVGQAEGVAVDLVMVDGGAALRRPERRPPSGPGSAASPGSC